MNVENLVAAFQIFRNYCATLPMFSPLMPLPPSPPYLTHSSPSPSPFISFPYPPLPLPFPYPPPPMQANGRTSSTRSTRSLTCFTSHPAAPKPPKRLLPLALRSICTHANTCALPHTRDTHSAWLRCRTCWVLAKATKRLTCLSCCPTHETGCHPLRSAAPPIYTLLLDVI